MEKINLQKIEKILIVFSSDTNILNENSAACTRMLEYAQLFKEFHVIVRSVGKTGEASNTGNLWIYPTNSLGKFSSFADLHKIAKKIIHSSWEQKNLCVLDVQDPFEHGLIGYFLSVSYGVPLRLQVHTDLFSPYFTRPFFSNSIRKLLAIFLLKKAKVIRVVSERIRQSLLVRGIKAPIAVIPIFVTPNAPLTPFKKYPQFEKVLITTSRLTKEKNLTFLLQVFTILFRKNPKLGLVIVGDGPEKKRLENIAYTLGLSGNVIFEGWQQDVSSFLASADAYINTSYYEGYGMSLLEAALQSLPIVTSDVGIVGEVFTEQNAVIFEDFDAEDWAFVISNKLSDPGVLSHFGQKGRDAALAHLSLTKGEYLEKYRDALISI